MNKDKVYAAPIDQVSDFRFDAKVADVFENMINRSVPGYALMLDLIGVITEKVFTDRFQHLAELNRMGARIRKEGPSAIVAGVPARFLRWRDGQRRGAPLDGSCASRRRARDRPGRLVSQSQPFALQGDGHLAHRRRARPQS